MAGVQDGVDGERGGARHFALCLYAYFPFGGLQRDALAIAKVLAATGQRVSLWVAHWQGEQPAGIQVCILPIEGRANYQRMRAFAEAVQRKAQEEQPDLLMGFNRMPGLDVYYAGDTCFLARKAGWLRAVERMLPRYRTYASQESAVFAPSAQTRILALSAREVRRYQEHHGTPSERFHLLPPGISRRCIAPYDWADQRRDVRWDLNVGESDKLLLMVASAFETKGLDRALHAFASLPAEQRERAHFIVIGEDKSFAYEKLAGILGIAERLRFLGGRTDVERYLWAADLLIHPARRENTGTVLLEAMVAGLPVLTVEACGYAHYIIEFDMGIVLPAPFDESALSAGLAELLFEDAREQRLQYGQVFASAADIYDMPRRAVQALLGFAGARPAIS